ncbi:MAG: 8-oxo-dGTP diphosphatase [Oscillospiraceae bacterium]|nr:8-oxo-dGTP diphosphatase [Oscillospiraceae bacterium]
MRLTTLCYLLRDGEALMLYRNKKAADPNGGKWIGVGGGLEADESPEDCLLREVREETGLTLTRWRFRGLVTFVSDAWPTEYMHLFTADGFSGEPGDCAEGELRWVPFGEIPSLPLWEGDRIFLRLLAEERPFFSLKLVYRGDALAEAALDGRRLPPEAWR